MNVNSHGRRLVVLACLMLSATAVFGQNAVTYLDDEAEPGGYDVTTTLTAAPAEMVLAEQANGDAYHLNFAPDRVELDIIQKNAKEVLVAAPARLDAGTALVVQRRGPVWRVIAAGKTLLEAEDDRWREGKVGTRGGLKDTRLQTVEEVYFDDDFMRVASDVALAGTKEDPRKGVRIADVKPPETVWHTTTGTWTTTGISENEQAQVAQSANPFAFKSGTAGANLALAGRPFWSDYAVEVSVKSLGAKAVGLVLYAQDPQNYLLLHWAASGPMQLRAMVDGKVRVLDEAPGGFEPKQWYRLRLSVARGVLRGYLDDAEVLRAQTGLFGRGQIGLYAENPTPEEAAVFDDVSARSIRDFHDDFHTVVPGRWRAIAGKFQFQPVAAPANKAGAFAVMGEGDWSDYDAEAAINLPADAAAGLLLHHQTGKGSYLLRFAGSRAPVSFAGRVQIVKIADNKTTVLAESITARRFDGSAARWSFAADHGYLQAACDGKLIVDAYDDSLGAGRAGLYAQAAGKRPEISQFMVEFPRRRPTWAKVPDLYGDDKQAITMGGWSTPQGLWVNEPITTTVSSTPAATPGDTKTYWHKGTFWGDRSIRFKMPKLDAGQSVVLVFNDVEANAATPGDSRQLTLQAGAGTLNANLVDNRAVGQMNAAVGKGDAAAKPKSWTGMLKMEGAVENTVVEIDRRGSYFIVRVGEGEKARTLLAARVM